MLTAKDLELVSELLEVGGHFELIRAVAQLKRILDEHREKEEGALATATTAAGASGARLAVYGRHGADITTDSYVSSEEDEDYQTSFVSSLSHLLNPSPSFAQPRARKRQLPKQRKIRGIVATAATPLRRRNGRRRRKRTVLRAEAHV
ncbi:hypothetical protein BASA81_002507 [Batrachochytrium salamandrivorans]|nr:hypothetical protein BASA81_002507 [Batrachochytrium salamandrivorans]